MSARTNDADALKYTCSMKYLEVCMNSVLSNIDESISFDEFLENLRREIDKFSTGTIDY